MKRGYSPYMVFRAYGASICLPGNRASSPVMSSHLCAVLVSNIKHGVPFRIRSFVHWETPCKTRLDTVIPFTSCECEKWLCRRASYRWDLSRRVGVVKSGTATHDCSVEENCFLKQITPMLGCGSDYGDEMDFVFEVSYRSTPARVLVSRVIQALPFSFSNRLRSSYKKAFHADYVRIFGQSEARSGSIPEIPSNPMTWSSTTFAVETSSSAPAYVVHMDPGGDPSQVAGVNLATGTFLTVNPADGTLVPVEIGPAADLRPVAASLWSSDLHISNMMPNAPRPEPANRVGSDTADAMAFALNAAREQEVGMLVRRAQELAEQDQKRKDAEKKSALEPNQVSDQEVEDFLEDDDSGFLA